MDVQGISSRRLFDPDKAGGPIRNLSVERIRITHLGVDVVEWHLSRFNEPGEAPNRANQV